MKLTIGMACHDDFHGVAFTIQSLALHHDLEACELLVIDNNPGSTHGRATQNLCAGLKDRVVRYVPMPAQTGTTQTRERIFAEARGAAVLVMDCHVLFPTGVIGRLKQWYAEHPDCGDLLSGPLILDSGSNWHTHFNDQWRGGMWGTWATAWKCTCASPLQLTTIEVGQHVEFRDLATSRDLVTRCDGCGRELPKLAWPGHQAALLAAGWQPLGFSDDDPPFEIPAQGLGVFSCRRDAWPGFNPHMRQFGGEEFYIHEKFRQRGAKALCLPWLKWWHRFARPDGPQYPRTLWSKVRNYVLGHQELGLPLDRLYRHFVSLDHGEEALREHLLHEHSLDARLLEGKSDEQLDELHRQQKLSEDEWSYLLADPVGRPSPPAPPNTTVSFETGRAQPPAGASLDEIFAWCQGVKRDLDQHLPLLRDLASKCDHVTEITKRRESTVGLLAGRPKALVSYQRESDILLKTLSEAIQRDAKERGSQRHVEQHTVHWGADSLSINRIEATDLLFIDSVHSAERLAAELELHAGQVRRFLVLRGTGAFGETAEGSKEPGLFHALRPWMEANPEWFVVFHTGAQYGMTVLGRLPEDRPAQQVHAWPPGFGPGTELSKMLAALDINSSPSCDCKAKAIQMDMWGVAGCREHRDTVIGWLREGAPRWSWTEKLAAAAKAVSTGLAFQLNPLDPFPSLVDEAICRAEKEEEARS